MKNQILVSLIITTRNRRDDLRECLKSISTQNDYPTETLVIDNASSDDSVEMVKQEFPFVKLIRLDRNIGCPGGRNIGILNSEGEVLFFLDDDSKIDTNAIQNVVRYFHDDGNISVVAPQIIEHGQPRFPPGSSGDRFTVHYLPYFSGISAIKRSVFEKNGLYPIDFVYGAEESDLAIRILNNGGRILYAPDVKVFHFPAGNRNANFEIQQRLVNGIIVLWKYAPLPRAIIGSIAKPLNYFLFAIRTRGIWGWIKGIINIPLAIIKTIRFQRNPIGWYPFMLQEQLGATIIVSWEQINVPDCSVSWLTWVKKRIRFNRPK